MNTFHPAPLIAQLNQGQLIALIKSATLKLFDLDHTNEEADKLSKLEDALGEYAAEVGRDDHSDGDSYAADLWSVYRDDIHGGLAA